MVSNYFPYELDELLESEGFSEFDESDEFDEFDESDEARRRRGGRRRPSSVRLPKRGGAVPKRPGAGYATKAELTATANRLDGRIAIASKAIKTVEGRVNALSTDQGRLRTDVNKLQGSVNDVRNMAMLMPLLSTQKTVTTTAETSGIPAGSKVVVDSGDSFSKLLPLLLFSGSFGGTPGGTPGGQSGSGGMFGGDSGGIMLVAMMMAMQNK